MPEAVVLNLRDSAPKGALAKDISDRLSQELVIALVGPVGSGVSTAAKYIANILGQQFQYEVASPIRMSDFIRKEMHRVSLTVPENKNISDYVKKMQDGGNALRQKYGAHYLAEKAVETIAKFRHSKGGYTADGTMLPGRRAYLIDSIKNLEELELLRQIYRETLLVFGIFAPDQIRKRRLINDGAQEKDVQALMDRDHGEVATFGQMTRKIFVEADFFICNDRKPEELERRLRRYLEIIFDTNIHTPTRAESAMYEATAAMASSACMSRQVGASIISSNGELISVGWNDVPKFRGGLYNEDNQAEWDEEKRNIQDNDHRCFKWTTRVCHTALTAVQKTWRQIVRDRLGPLLAAPPKRRACLPIPKPTVF